MIQQDDNKQLIGLLRKRSLIDDQCVTHVRAAGVLLVTDSLPLFVRNALNAAVKRGELGRYKRGGGKPEAYFHPDFEQSARQAQDDYSRETLRHLAGITDSGDQS